MNPMSTAVRNADIAALMREIADLLEIKDENPFRIRAYRNLARTLDNMGPSVQDMLAERRNLDDLAGVGPDLAGNIAEVAATGTSTLREELRRELPAGLDRLLGLGRTRRACASLRRPDRHPAAPLSRAPARTLGRSPAVPPDRHAARGQAHRTIAGARPCLVGSSPRCAGCWLAGAPCS